MNRPLFIDTNVPIYAAGTAHPLKEPCAEILLLIAAQPSAFITDAEVLQELLHRYLALRRWYLGSQVLQHFSTIMQGRIEPVQPMDVQRAAALADWYPGLSARDLLHAAVMERTGARAIITADRNFDVLPQLERLDPVDLSLWKGRVSAGG